MSIKKIGVENFRVFKNYTEFEIRPITLLTGPNNSGKSSLTKLLLLLQNGMEVLDFESDVPNLEGFENIISYGSKNRNLEITLKSNISILDEKFSTRFCYNNSINIPPTIQTFKGEDILFQFNYTTNNGELEFFDKGAAYLNLNIKFFIDYILSKKIKVSGYYYGPPEGDMETPEEFYGLTPYETSLDKIEQHVPPPPNLEIHNLKEELITFWNRNSDTHDITGEDWRNIALNKELNFLENSSGLLYDIFLNGKNVSKKYQNEALEIQKKIFSNLEFILRIDHEFNNTKELLKHIFDQTPQNFEWAFLKNLKELLNNDPVEIKPNRLGKLIFYEKLFFHSFNLFDDNGWDEGLIDHAYFKKTIFECLNDISFDFKDYFNPVTYISPQRGSQKRVLMNKSENEIDEIISGYSKLDDHSRKLPFLEKVLDILEIEGKLHIDRYAGFISTVALMQKNRLVSLSDLGYGYSQIIPLILKIILTKGSTVIIEEPEANLHPNLQSKLADVLVLILKEYPRINLIIETHSEYLIRRLQYLTAKKEVLHNQSIIYYFNSDKYVSFQEPKVKKIEIEDSGNLSENFGPGFFDEATRLQFDLLKTNKEQNN